MKIHTFIGRLIRQIPDKYLPMIRYAGLFANRMQNPFNRIRCQRTFCGHVWRIPRHRILRFEKFFDIRKRHRFVWECHDGHDGVVIPGTYKNMHAEIVTIDPKSLDPNTEVMRF